ncbi:hypothetical protein HCBG_02365 [Histoplasma capsulatum G186AR]|uniref:Uncharacterized protein n=1 Tax=Ajellomyces capsulatus (strain G186AR / H82 / ATCC MYA-2454 / RMSCC 2432) TaxID=447093 RepID=C0NIV8_AJECG|nr:uncharacterized protein HCBG_02365 [Histoplasma capsulatum G186AR]EEH08828.1 hypothetical protein HCBG_02365 [Histoplasma capsulatum G186AR]
MVAASCAAWATQNFAIQQPTELLVRLAISLPKLQPTSRTDGIAKTGLGTRRAAGIYG